MSKKQKILNIALSLFSEKGYSAVGVQEICKLSEITKPTLYYHFGSKEGLLQTLLNKHFTKINKKLSDSSVYTNNLSKTLYSMAETYFNCAVNNKKFFKMIIAMTFGPDNSKENFLVKTYVQEQFEIFNTVFKTAENECGISKERSVQYAATFIGMLNTYLSLLFNFNQTLNSKDIEDAIHQFCYGIYS